MDIGVGGDSSVWIAHTDGGVRRWNSAENKWNPTDGEATTQITVDGNWRPWRNQDNTLIWTEQ